MLKVYKKSESMANEVTPDLRISLDIDLCKMIRAIHLGNLQDFEEAVLTNSAL